MKLLSTYHCTKMILFIIIHTDMQYNVLFTINTLHLRTYALYIPINIIVLLLTEKDSYDDSKERGEIKNVFMFSCLPWAGIALNASCRASNVTSEIWTYLYM